jgi:hypothetical protein
VSGAFEVREVRRSEVFRHMCMHRDGREQASNVKIDIIHANQEA